MLDADSRLKAELEKHLIRRQHEETLKEKREEQLLRNGIKKIAQLEAELAEYIQK